MKSILSKVADADSSAWNFYELALVEDRLDYLLNHSEGLTKNICLKLLHSGGKRLRPYLALQGGMCFAPLNAAMIDAAVASELIHMASLVHDDIIDQAQLRRGTATVNSELGNHAAVLAGDHIFAQAFSLLTEQKLFRPMSYLCEAIQAMCSGEINQAGEQFDPEISRTQYFKRIEQKTAALLMASCKSGAACAGASEEQIGVMAQYGLQIGYAFQIIDDLVDYLGTPEQTGKPVNQDLAQGHITLPLILLLEDPSCSQWLAGVIRRQKISAKDWLKVRNLLQENGHIANCLKIVRRCIEKAKGSLNPLPDTAAKKMLNDLTEQLTKQIPKELLTFSAPGRSHIGSGL